MAEFARSFRDRVKQAFAGVQQRREFWEKILQGPVAELVFSGQREQAEKLADWNLDLNERVSRQVDQLHRLERLKRYFSQSVAELIVSDDFESRLKTKFVMFARGFECLGVIGRRRFRPWSNRSLA